jgi:phytoene dehydrogenase-like protein
MPEYAARMQVMEAASNLTFRDYLNSPDGSAYGIKHKVGQFDLIGRLPVANFYAAGQSALLPGIIGAMTSAFLVCRMIIGREGFAKILARRMCS